MTKQRHPQPDLHSAGVALLGSKSGRSGRGGDKIESLPVPPLSAGFSSEHIMAMSLRLKGPVCQPGARGISPSHSIKPEIN